MIYFAHPVNTYNTFIEAKVIEKIQEQFPDQVILNPNHPYIAHLYKKQGMKIFKKLVKMCDILICLPFEGGEIGAGKAKEISWGLKKETPCYYICNTQPFEYERIYTLNGYNVLTVKETREKLKK
jgi:hypothetical protein